MSSWRGVVTTLALFALAGSGMLAASSPVLAQNISEAERLLFMSDHLGKLKPPLVLRYRYVKSGSLEGSGQGSLEVRAVKRGGTTAYAASLLIDGQTVDLPGIENAKGNPALLMFLERDLKEMKRITGGSTTYYRKRIRLALAEKAAIRPATVQYEGKAVTASEIHIAPFVDDPARSRFEKYANKEYTFVLSQEVPGWVMRMQSLMREGGPGSATMIAEVVSLAGAPGQ